ncbi:hypothetical protein JYT29_00930 [Nitrospina gracilis]|nr:hypothetical protein [Nitrospina gracilis]
MSKKDINILIKLCRKLGESICDKGTFEERQTRNLIIKWNYKGNAFLHKFSDPEKSSLFNRQYSEMRKNLRACGLNPPREHASGFNGTAEQKESLEELWVHVGTDDEGETPYGGDLNR